MYTTTNQINVTVILYSTGGIYSARSLEYDLHVVGTDNVTKTKLIFLEALGKAVISDLAAKISPLSKYDPAPKSFFEMSVLAEKNGPSIPLYLPTKDLTPKVYVQFLE